MCEIGWIAVETQHVAAAPLDDAETPLPKDVFFCRQLGSVAARRKKKWSQWVANLVAYVRVCEVEAGYHESVQAADIQYDRFSVQFGADEQVDEDDVCRIDKRTVLPAPPEQ